MIGKLCARLTAVPRVTLRGTVTLMSAAPRWTVTPLENSATYHLTVTATPVAARAKVTVVVFVIWPETWPSEGLLVLSLTPKSRNERVVSIASESAAVAEVLPAPIVSVPNWTPLSVAAGASEAPATANRSPRASPHAWNPPLPPRGLDKLRAPPFVRARSIPLLPAALDPHRGRPNTFAAVRSHTAHERQPKHCARAMPW